MSQTCHNVFLCLSLIDSLKKYIALKITTAHSSASENETKIHEHLSRQKLVQHPGQKHVMTLLASFEHHGPNGSHRCLAVDVMGPNANGMVMKLPKPLRPIHPVVEDPYEKRHRYPLWMAKSMLRQILLGIDYLHKCGVVHGDLQPGNILFSVQDLSSVLEKDIAHPVTIRKVFEKIVNRRGEVKFNHLEVPYQEDYYSQRQRDGKPDPSFPRYIMGPVPMFEHVNLKESLHIKISDLGGAVLNSQGKLVTPLGLRSPEMILGEAIGSAQDIWSFGCLIFEFLTSRMLFSIFPPYLEYGDGDDKKRRNEERWAETNDSHVLQIAELLGKVPPSFMARFARSEIYFDKDGQLIDDNRHESQSDDESDEYFEERRRPASIENDLDQEKGTDLSNEEAENVIRLLRSILQVEAADRPTAETLLRDPWFAEPTSKQRSAPPSVCRHTNPQSHERHGGDRSRRSGRKNQQ